MAESKAPMNLLFYCTMWARNRILSTSFCNVQKLKATDPLAPEWQAAVQHHLNIWDRIISRQAASGANSFGFTCEFGPAPYMPLLPFTRQPVTDQWEVNAYMKNMNK